ncbi:hypothetical protein [uncultured Tenacibaculum sp.]|uniref:hypothetical protein n=1 Tax=uncultured Tenacibaculum sp. TaxID=174713 RepID=UPI002612F4D3|nr:hypothetical protein [uncultured Tenacibaculum sp.]
MIKTIIISIIYLISLNVFSQRVKTLYFLINEKDSLIKKQVAKGSNRFEGYTLINDGKIIKEYISPSKITGNDIEIDSFESFSFTFNRNNDTIVDKTYFNKKKIIKTRKKVFEINIDNKRIVFIEPTKNGKFILREVIPIFFE